MFVGELHPYQKEAKDKAVDRGQYLLAHVMGAGKTPTTIAVVEEWAERGLVRCGLVIVMAALKFQWQEQIKQFSRSRSIVIDGTEVQRARAYKIAPLSRYVIMSYNAVVNDWKHVRRLPIDFVILDEATAIKTARAQRTKKVKKLAEPIPYRLALTGTPIENRPEELFSIMEFVDPTVLGPPATFERTFIERDTWGKFRRGRNLRTLRSVMGEVMDRKSYDDIKDYLPAVVNTTTPVRLDERNRKLYNVIRDDLLVHLAEATKGGASWDLMAHYGHSDDPAGDQARGDIAARMGALRMLCDAPHLLRYSADKFDDDDIQGGSAYASQLKEAGLLTDHEPATSPKLETFKGVIEEIMQTDYDAKVVVFSFFRPMLDLAQQAAHRYKSVLFHGGMNSKQRDASRTAFMHDPSVKLFFSSDAGGYGIDLPMAQHLISLDLPWSAGKLDQRNSRIIRNSSHYKVVFNSALLVSGSIEEWVKNVVLDKQNLGRAFLDGKFDSKGTYTPSLQSLQRFLAEADV